MKRVASGEWRVASGEWQVAGGEWRVAGGVALFTRPIHPHLRQGRCP